MPETTAIVRQTKGGSYLADDERDGSSSTEAIMIKLLKGFPDGTRVRIKVVKDV